VPRSLTRRSRRPGRRRHRASIFGYPDSASQSPLADGPTPARAIIVDESGELLGELIVWVRSGRLSALEYAWVTDEMPDRLPSVDEITIEPIR